MLRNPNSRTGATGLSSSNVIFTRHVKHPLVKERLVLGEQAAVAGGQPQLILGDFNVESQLIPCLKKGLRVGSGLTWRKPGLVATPVKRCLGSQCTI